MRAAFALLANLEAYNLVRRLAWRMHTRYHTGTRHCRLPPHISLKQPFKVGDLAALEAYMDELARSIDPFEVCLTRLQVVPITSGAEEYGLLIFDVQETPTLRSLHDRLNDELTQRFGDTRAAFDGAEYRFHMTVMIGGQPVEEYRKFLSGVENPVVNLRYTVRELAMFTYDEPPGPDGDYLCYRVLPIGAV